MKQAAAHGDVHAYDDEQMKRVVGGLEGWTLCGLRVMDGTELQANDAIPVKETLTCADCLSRMERVSDGAE